MKRIAVLNVGGDCPGLNAVLRALIVKGAEEDIEIIGVYDGFKGLVEDRMFIMTKEHVSGKLPEGGIILGSSKFDPYNNSEDFKKLKRNVQDYQITALVLLTGHTGAKIALRLKEDGISSVIIPATIDNDLNWTHMSIGFLTGLQTVTTALDYLHSTASSGHRVIVVEVGGDEAGWLAAIGGMAGGADYIMVPEVEVNPQEMLANINRRYKFGKRFSIIVVEEKCKLPQEITKVADGIKAPHLITVCDVVAEYIRENMPKDFDCQTLNLGYMQRGGSPLAFDRFLAFKFGISAIEYVKRGEVNVALGLNGFDISHMPYSEDILINREIRPGLYEMAKLFF